nr:transposase [Streptomyces rubrogriseus]
MHKPYPREFRDDVVRVAENCEPGVPLRQIAADFGISETCLQHWMRRAAVEAGAKLGVTKAESDEAPRAAQARPVAGAGERRSSGTGSLPTRPAPPVRQCRTGPRGGSPRATAGGRCSGRSRAEEQEGRPSRS